MKGPKALVTFLVNLSTNSNLKPMLYSHIIHMQLYTYTCRNILNTITTSEDTSLEKYTFHFIESVVCERELETEQRLQHIDHPSSSRHSSVSFSFSWATEPGASLLRACSHCSISNTASSSELQLLNGGPEGPLCWALFSLQHPIPN